MHFYQRTVLKPASCTGVGVHSGRKVNLTVKPAPTNHGIRFIRTDLPGNPGVTAHFNNVVDTSLATVIGSEGCIVSTIEHLMASFAGLGIDNAIVEVDAYELPIMDGSAGPFTAMIRSAGIENQDAPRHFFHFIEPIELSENGKSVCIYPSNSFTINCTIAYDHPLIGEQTLVVDVDEDTFEKQISTARTFGFYHEVEMLKRYGLARGGSLDNAIVIDKDDGILNEGELRFSDEFVRHKILDCIGDFSLLGMPMLGRIVATRSGHAFNHAFLEKIFSEKKAWKTSPVPPDILSKNADPKHLAI